MNIIKEFCRTRNIIVIRTNTYSKTYAHISNLILLAKKDFDVKDEDIIVVEYGGERYKRTIGIEFHIPSGTDWIPSEYTEISELENTI